MQKRFDKIPNFNKLINSSASEAGAGLTSSLFIVKMIGRSTYLAHPIISDASLWFCLKQTVGVLHFSEMMMKVRGLSS